MHKICILREVRMESIQHIRKTDLARNTRQVIRAAQRGQTVVVESHGQPEVAIMDIVDYHIVRPVMRYHREPPAIEPGGGLPEALHSAAVPQAQYDLVLAHYLSISISLGRAAELLGLPWIDLRTRFIRLDVPLHLAPANLEEAQDAANLAALLLDENGRR
jgi:prevent-host-death family protein